MTTSSFLNACTNFAIGSNQVIIHKLSHKRKVTSELTIANNSSQDIAPGTIASVHVYIERDEKRRECKVILDDVVGTDRENTATSTPMFLYAGLGVIDVLPNGCERLWRTFGTLDNVQDIACCYPRELIFAVGRRGLTIIERRSTSKFVVVRPTVMKMQDRLFLGWEEETIKRD